MTYLLTDLPHIVLEHIFSFLTYDNISQIRIVNQQCNEIGSKMLNKGYYSAEKFHDKTLKAIKAKLPRRESERRIHPLARQCDILIAIETRLSMLAMTYSRWIDAKACCFIPGKVIDEIMRVLRCVQNDPCPPRAHEILQELRDISSMAMEHFDEKILPGLKNNIMVASQRHAPGQSSYGSSIGWFPSSNNIDAICRRPPAPSRVNVTSFAAFSRLYFREAHDRRKIKEQQTLLTKQAAEISVLRTRVDEWEAKMRDVLSNLSKAKEQSPSTSEIGLPSASPQRSTVKRRNSQGDSPCPVPVKNVRLSPELNVYSTLPSRPSLWDDSGVWSVESMASSLSPPSPLDDEIP